jgi:hypothetical protein
MIWLKFFRKWSDLLNFKLCYNSSMSLEEVTAEAVPVSEKRKKRQREIEEYREECARIFNEVERANEQLDGGMAVGVTGPDDVEYLVLKVPVTEELETPNFWGATERHTAFVLSPQGIYVLGVWESRYVWALEKLEPENRTEELFKQPAFLSPYSGDGKDLQKAINLSMSRTIPHPPPSSPDYLKGVDVKKT